jgi:hypothetical protein
MSKRPRMESQIQPPQVHQQVDKSESIPEYRRCPVCWGARRGYGVAYCTRESRTYYKCIKTAVADGAPCGHTWTADVVVGGVFIESRTVSISTR